jgi:hypothetical protein
VFARTVSIAWLSAAVKEDQSAATRDVSCDLRKKCVAFDGSAVVSDTNIFRGLKKTLRICISTNDLTEPAESIVLTHGDRSYGKLQISRH